MSIPFSEMARIRADDPALDYEKNTYKVLLNGVDTQDVIECSVRDGWVRVLERNSNGVIIHDKHGPFTTMMRGVVEIIEECRPRGA